MCSSGGGGGGSGSASPPMQQLPPYAVCPLPGSPFGAEVTGLDITAHLQPDVIERIKQDVTTHQVVVLRDQGVMSGADQVRVSGWFGELESTFYKHPRSLHPDVFRVSNMREEGCTGSFMEQPFSHSIYHIVSVPKAGSTAFASLDLLVQALPKDQRQKWERLWPVSDRRSGAVHPLIYAHPDTGRPTMCVHTGMTDLFLWDADTPARRASTPLETVQLLDEIDSVFRGDLGKAVQYEHVWRAGDFIISDNLAVAHEAAPSTQLPVSQVGLRVMHRCTIAGKREPKKSHGHSALLDRLEE